MKPMTFNMKPQGTPNPDNNFEKTQVGLIAEDIAAIDPRLAIYEQDGRTPKSYRQESIIATLVAAVQAQQSQISALQHRIDAFTSAAPAVH